MTEQATLPPPPDSSSDRLLQVRAMLLSRRYDLRQLIAKGGMGEVYEARHLLLDRRVAVKVLTLPGERMRQMFLQEGRALASVRHPNVVEVHDLDEVGGVHFMIMELLEGESLETRLRRTGSLPVGQACALVKQVLAGLGATHERGIVHRDVKPSNVFIELRDAVPDRVKLIDFGICSEPGTGPLLAGTPHYLAPEQLLGDAVDHRADLWAVGVLLYETLTGSMPFQGGDLQDLQRAIVRDAPRSPRELVPGLSPAIDAAILRLLAKDPASRFADVSEVIAACSGALRPELEIVASAPRDLALVVDESPARSALTLEVLAGVGLLGVVARDAREATELLEDLGAPRIAIVNLATTHQDAFELLKELRRAGSPRDTLLVVTSKVPAFLEAALDEPGLSVSAAVPSGDLLALRGALDHALSGTPWPRPSPSARPMLVDDPLRLRAVQQVAQVSNGPTDARLQEILLELSKVFNVPVALVSLVLQDKQWFKAQVGLTGQLLETRETPIDQAFCRHVVESGEVLMVPDAREHPAFRDNPLVRDGVVTSYVGAPLVTDGGRVLGTLCLIDSIPHSFGARDVEDLVVLARRIAGELALLPGASELQELEESDDIENGPGAEAALEVDEAHRVVTVTPGFLRLFDLEPKTVVGTAREDLMSLVSSRFEEPGAFVAKTRVAKGGPFMAHGTFRLRTPQSTVRWLAKPFTGVAGRYRVREWFVPE